MLMIVVKLEIHSKDAILILNCEFEIKKKFWGKCVAEFCRQMPPSYVPSDKGLDTEKKTIIAGYAALGIIGFPLLFSQLGLPVSIVFSRLVQILF